MEDSAVSPFRDHPFQDRKSTRLNSSHVASSYAVFCLKKKSYVETQALKYWNPGTRTRWYSTIANRARRGYNDGFHTGITCTSVRKHISTDRPTADTSE